MFDRFDGSANFSQWFCQVETLLTAEKLLKYINEEPPVLKDDEWIEKDAKARM